MPGRVGAKPRYLFSLGGWGCVSWSPGLAVAAGMAWFLIVCEPARRVVLVTDRRL